MTKKLAIIGAGPKAFAIVAKAKALQANGFSVPEITIFEQNEVGSNWTGKYEYTDGYGTIDVTGFKDVCYPDTLFGENTDLYMKQNFSFYFYLSEKKILAKYLNAGQPALIHQEFVQYLLWLQIKINPKIIYQKVIGLKKFESNWIVTTRENSQHEFNGVVFTGLGETIADFPFPSESITAKNYWQKKNLVENENIILVGGGVSAATILEDLSTKKVRKITWISRRPLYTRSANFSNNMLFSFPEKYQLLPEYVRQEFCKHTDGNTINGATHKAMSKLEINFLVADTLECNTHGILTDHGFIEGLPIVATGYDKAWFLDLIDKNLWPIKGNKKESTKFIINNINQMLTINDELSGLHMPMLSALKQGIGLPTLTCLSRLSDYILRPYVN